MLCEFIYVAIVLIIGIPLIGKLQMPAYQFAINMLNTALIIIAFCSIYNFITMICSDITISTTICTLGFILLFIMNIVTGSALTSSAPTVKNYGVDERGNVIVIGEQPNLNYEGEAKYNLIKTIYLLNPESQATEVQDVNSDYTSEMPIYSIALILLMNIGGIYIFSRKQLK